MEDEVNGDLLGFSSRLESTSQIDILSPTVSLAQQPQLPQAQQLSPAQQSQVLQLQQQAAQALQQQQQRTYSTQRRRYTGSSIPTDLPSVNTLPVQQLSPSPLLVQPPTVNGFNINEAAYVLPMYNPIQQQLRTSTIRQPSPQTRERKLSRTTEVNGFRLEQAATFTSAPSVPQRNPGVSQGQLSPRHSVPNMQQKMKMQNAQTQVNRPPFRTHHSNSTVSTSLPTTPRHPRAIHGKSRSPSPPFTLDSPRSANSDPVSPYPPHGKHVPSKACEFETAMVMARRRMPYSLGTEHLPREKPTKDALSPEDDAALTEAMNALYQELLPSEESNERRTKFVQKLENLLNDEWPGKEIKALPFGSTENKLCTTDSDVDICITTNMKELENVCLLAKALAKRGMERVVCISNAKIPIVKIWDPEYEVSCDMNVNNPLALDNTRMMKTYVDIDPRVRPLAMIIKHWTKQRVLKDAAGGGTISSYTWICIIINFLQMRHPPILPALHQREHEKRPPVNGVDVSFDDNLEKLRGFGDHNTETLGSLLFAFFKKFGYEMDYENKVISVRHGKLLSKVEKGFNLLPNNRLCVEEPFNTNRSLSNGADDTSVKGLHLEFRRAYKTLAEGKPNLTLLCEEYVFPKEEPSHNIFVKPAPTRPVNLTRSHSQSGGQRRSNGSITPTHPKSRQYSSYLPPHSNNYNNRRASSGAAMAGNALHLPQLFQSPESYVIVQNADGTFSYTALANLQRPLQILQQQQRDAQIGRQAQVQQNQQNSTSQSGDQSQNQAQGQQNQSETLNTPSSQTQYGISQNALQARNVVYPLMQPLYYYNSNGGIEFQMNPLMMHSALDPRLSLSRSGRHQVGNGLRSRSQPAPQGDVKFRASIIRPGVTGHNSEDEQEFGDFPVNGMPVQANTSNMNLQPGLYSNVYPVGMPLEEEEQYYGYTYRDNLDGSTDTGNIHKDALDRRKRLSRERLQQSKFGAHRRASQPPSPIIVAQFRYGQAVPDPIWSSSDGDGERSVSQDSFDEEPRSKGPLIVNGSGTGINIPVTPPFEDNNYTNPSLQNDSPHSDVFPSVYGHDFSMSSSLDQLEQPQRYYSNVVAGNSHADAKSMAAGVLSPHSKMPGLNPYSTSTLAPAISLPVSAVGSTYSLGNGIISKFDTERLVQNVDLAYHETPKLQYNNRSADLQVKSPINSLPKPTRGTDLQHVLSGRARKDQAEDPAKSWTKITKAEAVNSATNGKPLTIGTGPLNRKKSDIVDISTPSSTKGSSRSHPTTELKQPLVAKNLTPATGTQKNTDSKSPSPPNGSNKTTANTAPASGTNMTSSTLKASPSWKVKNKKTKKKKAAVAGAGDLNIVIPIGEEKKGG